MNFKKVIRRRWNNILISTSIFSGWNTISEFRFLLFEDTFFNTIFSSARIDAKWPVLQSLLPSVLGSSGDYSTCRPSPFDDLHQKLSLPFYREKHVTGVRKNNIWQMPGRLLLDFRRVIRYHYTTMQTSKPAKNGEVSQVFKPITTAAHFIRSRSSISFLVNSLVYCIYKL